ncbi:hypothetical protein [Streptomyces graminilatus]|uniref:hypothetical protein n=1 Tax=Streptomyces graminilatus TaxID=1464070 RepID=UPI0006E41238|nr:hypothetical protein [Streptomyces graminilatus]
MTMPFDGSTAGYPEGRPRVRPLHSPADPSAAYFREVAQFVALHLGRAPGVLWPEHDHPPLGDGADDGEDPAAAPDLDAFAARIAAATGLAAGPGRVGAPPGHLLVHQIAGAATWDITGVGGDGQGASLRYRLRAGEVLYVPDGWSRTAEPARDARWAVFVLAPEGSAAPDQPATG